MTREKEYKITKDACREMIQGVCDHCGGELQPMETVDNADDPTYWSGCPSCEIFCWGVSKDVYNAAKYLVDEERYTAYSHMTKPTEKSTEFEREYYRYCQIAGSVSLVMKVLHAHKQANQKEPA